MTARRAFAALLAGATLASASGCAAGVESQLQALEHDGVMDARAARVCSDVFEGPSVDVLGAADSTVEDVRRIVTQLGRDFREEANLDDQHAADEYAALCVVDPGPAFADEMSRDRLGMYSLDGFRGTGELASW